MSDQQTEKATPQREKKAREAGDWVRSRELLSGVAMLAGLITLGVGGDAFVVSWRQCFSRCVVIAVSGVGMDWGVRELTTAMRVALLPAVVPTAMVMGACLCAVVVVGIGQGGGVNFSVEALQPKLSRVSPASHVKNLFSMRTLARVGKSLLPAVVVGALGWRALHSLLGPMAVMSLMRLPATFQTAYGLGVKAAWVMVVWSGIDYVVEYSSWSKRLKMSKQEMKDEMKQTMGNPQVKGRVRQAQRAMRKRRAKTDMTRASVVVTNPTHYAVALEFSFETMQAPMVLTKGRDLHALDIREEAKAAGVPIVENPPLARSLYRSVEQGQAIPYELYAAVAGILAYLFREQQEAKAREEKRAAQNRKDARAAAMRPSVTGLEGEM
jgi:flagellar biosynthetic protein FlhB